VLRPSHFSANLPRPAGVAALQERQRRLRSRAMEDTWSRRDLPVLDAAVRLVDEGAVSGWEPEVSDIAAKCGLPEQEIATALQAFNGEFLELGTSMGPVSGWWVKRVATSARRAVGQWPTGESLITQLVHGIGEAAEKEMDPDRRQRLRRLASELGGMAKAIAVNVASQVLEHQIPH
jgi:hypothetical protein